MKLTHVFGLVVAVHAAVFTVIFATPGCRSTGKAKPRPEETDPAAAASSSVSPVDSIPVAPMTHDAANPGNYAATPSEVAPVAPGSYEASSSSSSLGVRFAPTRPAPEPVVESFAAPVPTTSATHTVAKGDSLWSIAKKYGITVDELAAANQLAKTATLRLGQSLAVPSKAASASSSGAGDAGNTYAVKSGDTLGSIARKQGTTVAALRTVNNLSGDGLRVGQKLVIPGNATGLAESSVTTSAAPLSASAPRAGTGTYTVVSGDTLGSIARRSGVKQGELAILNNITDPAKLRVGQVLKLPSGAKPVAPAAATASAPSAPAFTPAPAVESAPAGVIPVAPAGDATGVSPVEPVTPVEPMAVPVIRIDG